MARMRALRVRRKPHTVFGTIKAQALSKQVELVLVFIIMRWRRSDERFWGFYTPKNLLMKIKPVDCKMKLN